MQTEIVHRLLTLNRQFYATVAEPFNRTRLAESPGKQQLLAYLDEQPMSTRPHAGPVQVLDVGCGNGRLAWLLARRGREFAYTGVDGEAQLLESARENTQSLAHVSCRWVLADLAEADWYTGWHTGVGDGTALYDWVFCLATLQHLPGFAMRARLVADLARMAGPDGWIALSAWQFLTSERLASRQIEWDVVGIDPACVEPGDALLPWKQERYAVRYVHQIDLAEMHALARHAGLTVERTFWADGREGNLNLYALLRKESKTR